MPQTFGKIAETILTRICSTKAQEVHIIFDRYMSPSIKDCERQSRLEYDVPYTIHGHLQSRPTDFQGSLKNYRFKEALVKFLAEHWESNHIASILKDKKVLLTVENQCFSFKSVGDEVIKVEEDVFSCEHEEADTRIMFHISKLPSKSRVLIKASDTDVLVIVLGNIHKVPDLKIWLVGSTTKRSANNDLNCISCTDLAASLGPTLCLALPAFHAFTGSDYTAAFYNKGKVRPFKIFSQNNTFQEVFSSLRSLADACDENKTDIIQTFVCLMYGVKNCNRVNMARYIMFTRIYSSSNNNERFLKKIKNFDSSQIPPCWVSINQKLLRTIFVSSMWLNATEANCINLNITDCGWTQDVHVKPIGFVGDLAPYYVEDVVRLEEQDNEITDPESSDESDDD